MGTKIGHSLSSVSPPRRPNSAPTHRVSFSSATAWVALLLCRLARRQTLHLVDQGTELGKAAHVLTFEFALPPDLPDDLTHDLCQPAQGMSGGQRDRIGGRWQEVAALHDQHFQIDFESLPVQKDHWGRIPLGYGGPIHFELPDKSLGRIPEGPCALADIDCRHRSASYQRAFGCRPFAPMLAWTWRRVFSPIERASTA